MTNEANKFIEENCAKDALVKKLLKKEKRPKEYDLDVLQFAQTLRFYSVKAYEFLRKYFWLPSKSTLNEKLKGFKALPGFHMESFEELKTHKGDPDYASASLIIDGVHIKAYSEYVQQMKKVFGHVDYGPDIPLDKPEGTVANEALTVMLVGYRKYWKMPIGYFLVNGTPAQLVADVINQALIYSHAAGVNVYNTTMDGHVSNINAVEKLGCKIFVNDRSELVVYFKHPVDGVCYNVLFYPDPPHMFKNLRNAFENYRVIFWPGKGLIKWEYIERLHKIQEEHGLRAGGNKLT